MHIYIFCIVHISFFLFIFFFSRSIVPISFVMPIIWRKIETNLLYKTVFGNFINVLWLDILNWKTIQDIAVYNSFTSVRLIRLLDSVLNSVYVEPLKKPYITNVGFNSTGCSKRNHYHFTVYKCIIMLQSMRKKRKEKTLHFLSNFNFLSIQTD